jgi:hypothetical protein
MLVCSVQTDGINIDEMLQYDKILDLRRLSCNNVHVMARYLLVPLHPSQCFGSGSAWIRIDFARLDPDLYPGGQKDLQK